MTDPTKKYPQPPFDGQEQKWPGLAGKMQPVRAIRTSLRSQRLRRV